MSLPESEDFLGPFIDFSSLTFQAEFLLMIFLFVSPLERGLRGVLECINSHCHSDDRREEDVLLSVAKNLGCIHFQLRCVLEILRFALNDRGREYRVILSVSEESGKR